MEYLGHILWKYSLVNAGPEVLLDLSKTVEKVKSPSL